MMTIPRGLARSFRAVIRKCQTARPRPPAPPVLVEVRDGHLHLACVLDGVGVVLSVPAAECEIERVLVPMDILDAVEGALVEIAVSSRKGTARWESRDGPKTQSFNLNETAEQAVGPVVPAELHSVAPTFLTALHECGRTAAREPARYALHRVQVNGKTGTVAATDGKLALVQRGFKLPFRDAVLVPALPLFGVKELASETDVRIGREADRLVVQAGPWTVTLTIDAVGRFPDVAGVIPKSPASTALQIDDRDADELVEQLPEWPDTSDGTAAVTLDVNDGIDVRSRNEESHEEREFRLAHSTSAGPAVRIAVDRRHLVRALTLGFRTFRLAPGQPLVAEGSERTLIAVTLEDVHAVKAVKNPNSTSELRRFDQMKSEPNGRHQPAPVENPAEWLDPLAEAEALRAALSEAAVRVGRLLQCLKQWKRHRRVLESAFTSIKSLGLGQGGEP